MSAASLNLSGIVNGLYLGYVFVNNRFSARNHLVEAKLKPCLL